MTAPAASGPAGPAGARTLVAGVGNILLSDDGFGSEVARRLLRHALPDGVEVTDVGIRGVHLAYQLLEGYDTCVLVDTVGRGDPPGTITVLEPRVDDLVASPVMDAHDLDPGAVLALLRDLGGGVDRLVLVGCEPGSTDEGIGLSPPVAAAVDRAVVVVHELVRTGVAAPRRRHPRDATDRTHHGTDSDTDVAQGCGRSTDTGRDALVPDDQEETCTSSDSARRSSTPSPDAPATGP